MLNKVLLIGNIGKDAIFREVGDKGVIAFSMATNENYKDAKGEWQTVTEWHNISYWNKYGSSKAPTLTKGKKVYVEGKLRTEKVEKDGKTTYYTEVVADRVLLVDRDNRPSPVQDIPF